MTVKQLIETLQQLDAEAMVVTSGYEGGYKEISDVAPIRLKLHVNDEWYYGEHEQDDNGECQTVFIG